jgi:CheY-like chemotaxis protein
VLAADHPAARITGHRTRRVLLIEDAQPDALVICQMIESEADRVFDVTYVADLASAVACLETERFDAILLDLNLPDMTGIDILKQIKENKYLKASPVVVLTTTDDSQEIKRCYELGCNVYITKPVNYENFANAIRQLGLFFSVIQVPPAAT